MPNTCAVPDCKSNYPSNIKKEGTKTAFKFPLDEHLKQAWVNAIRRKDFKPTPHSSVCIKHFRDSDIKFKSGLKNSLPYKHPRLKPDVVPSIFPRLPRYMPVIMPEPKKYRIKKSPKIVGRTCDLSIKNKISKKKQKLGCSIENNKLNLVEDKKAFNVGIFKNVEPDEIAAYQKLFPELEHIVDRPVHCTSCSFHIGTAPINEAVIKMHPVLRTIQCKKCYTFYNSGKFEKGIDGSEFYCRWCGQGGEVYCCSKCPKVYCRRCIERNLPTGKVDEIQNNDNWKCFACDPTCILKLKADYWALLNFIEKQKKEITKLLTKEERDLAMSKDGANCCKKVKKRKLTISTDSSPLVKRNHIEILPPTINEALTKNSKSKKPRVTEESKRQCSSDIGSILCPNNSPPNAPSNITTIPQKSEFKLLKITRITNTTQPVQPASKAALLNTLLNVHTAQLTKNTLSRTINGFDADLNSAAQHKIYKLPDGTMIQIRKKQPTLPCVGNVQTSTMPPPIQASAKRIPPTLIAPISRHPPLLLISNPRTILSNRSANPHNPLPPLSESEIHITSLSEPTDLPNSRVATAKAEFQIRVEKSMEVCQHIIGKMKTLTTSAVFKNVKTLTDVNDLAIHFSYLLRYAVGRFKTMQETFDGDMEIKGFDPECSKSDDDDIKIFKPNIKEFIALGSDKTDVEHLEQTNKNTNVTEPDKNVAETEATLVEFKEEEMHQNGEVTSDVPDRSELSDVQNKKLIEGAGVANGYDIGEMQETDKVDLNKKKASDNEVEKSKDIEIDRPTNEISQTQDADKNFKKSTEELDKTACVDGNPPDINKNENKIPDVTKSTEISVAQSSLSPNKGTTETSTKVVSEIDSDSNTVSLLAKNDVSDANNTKTITIETSKLEENVETIKTFPNKENTPFISDQSIQAVPIEKSIFPNEPIIQQDSETENFQSFLKENDEIESPAYENLSGELTENLSPKKRTTFEITINVSNVESIDEDIFENLIEEINEVGDNTNDGSLASEINENTENSVNDDENITLTNFKEMKSSYDSEAADDDCFVPETNGTMKNCLYGDDCEKPKDQSENLHHMMR